MKKNRREKRYGNIIVIQRANNRYGVVDAKTGVPIVPFGKYSWIDAYDHGLARVIVNKGNEKKWGIINEQGVEVLPVKYDNIWNFVNKNRNSTLVILGIEACYVNLDALAHRDDAQPWDSQCDDYDDSYQYDQYGEFAGTYAQDVMGYSDDEIYDVFEGDPDAYWNID